MARTTIAQKLRDQIGVLERDIHYEKTRRAELKAKLERFEEQENKENGMKIRRMEELADQVIWLRDLVEKVVVKPEVQELTIKAKLEFDKRIRCDRY